MKRFSLFFWVVTLCISSIACKQDTNSTSNPSSNTATTTQFKVDFEKFTLDNGLTVIMHQDNSDPVVAVALTAHVGSAREIEGRTGFAHLFEHLLFLESENLGKGGLDKMSARIGGSGANGSTSRDRTNYFQTVPKDALEKMIWAEADKLGYFINTVTEPVLAKEKQVVKNEKRQSVDNRPYGHVSYVIGKALYPEDHPYNWQVIGSLEDLQNATLQDVKDFYNRWYTPNNTTLTIAGDFDPEQAKAWVHKYFDEIQPGQAVAPLEKRPVTLNTTKKLYYEDNFARLPQLSMTWPTVPNYHPDSYPLQVLATYLSDGKKAPFNQVLIDKLQLTNNVTMFQYGAELAGEYRLVVNAYASTPLDSVAQGVATAFAKFEQEGISQADLDRIKAGQETRFYSGLSSVLGKGFQLAQYEIFAGDPDYINQDVQRILAVTPEDVQRVYQTYIKDQHYVATSFVPIGQTDLVLSGSTLADVIEEKIVAGAEDSFDASIAAQYEKTPSSFDRSVEPPYGEAPEVVVPEVWDQSLSSGMEVYGIENSEVPLVQFQFNIKGGLLLESTSKVGVSNLLAQLLLKGTATKTPEQLENAIESLGAQINCYAGDQYITISGTTLAKNYTATMDLVREILLEPRWDTTEFELLKQSTSSQLEQQLASPRAIASNEYRKLIYGKDALLAQNNLGTPSSVAAIGMDDLKAYYDQYISPSVTVMQVVGAISQQDALAALDPLNESWEVKEVVIPEVDIPQAPSRSNVYFYDVPDAKQSMLRIGYPAVAATHEDYYPLQIANYRLGGGGFASELTQQLREGKGYTYGIRSSFNGSTLPGPFTISSGVRSNVTYESTALIKDILENYPTNFDAQDLEVTKSYMIKSTARAFETMGAKLNMLGNISQLGMPVDYAKQRAAVVKDMTVERVQQLARTYMNPDQMIYLVVGDKKTQFQKLEDLGYGTPTLLNPKEKDVKD